MLGLGAWIKDLTVRIGEDFKKPLRAMREYVEPIQQLFTMEEVTYQGEFVNLDRIHLDVESGETSPRDIPIYIGATGDKMLQLAGEICDGVILNYGMSVERIKHSISLVEKGAKKAGKTLADVDLPELVAVSLSDEDPDQAVFEAQKLVTMYLALEKHFRDHLGADPEVINYITSRLDWPVDQKVLEEVAPIVPEELVRTVVAVGTADECRATVKDYVDAGISCPILYPVMGNIKEVVDAFADGV
jgi:5,10-methylenetetrahydromethanopterin reductase